LVADQPANPAHQDRRTRVVRHARAITFQLAEVAVSGDLCDRIIAAIHWLRAPPVPA
jgi:hypothetical protein